MGEYKKTSQRASLNIGSSSGGSKKTSKKVAREVKKLSGKIIAFALCFVLGGLVLGSGVWFFISKNDCFEILGNEYPTLTLNIEDTTTHLESDGQGGTVEVKGFHGEYVDDGVKIISLGKDISDKVRVEWSDGLEKIEKNVDGISKNVFVANEVGSYWIKYFVEDIKYSQIFTVEKIRIITFLEISGDESEIENSQDLNEGGQN